ncbi:exosortase F system-associated protein [Salinimicrobium catena]|uniref:exosortase F system-associated membrane protein n=1 Tax=Salinimicrobium catena TaxID=390640 RepID=UPI002FE4911A
MNPYLRMFLIGLLVAVLALIRMYEYQYFYDPFMYFFERAFQEQQEYHFTNLMFFNVFLRFLLNTLVSLTMLYVAFKNFGIIKFAAVIYAIFFIVLFPLFIYLMQNVTPEDYLAAFYVRRFLAHPVLILILLPAFYYYRLSQAEKG